jgi:hypothetical protein
MKKIFFIIPLLFMSCIKKDITSIIIQDDQSSEVNLFKGEYTVHFMNKKDANYKFYITEDEITEIKDTYDDQNIKNYENEFLITNDDEPIMMPASDMKYIISFSDDSKQTFTVKTDFIKNPLDKEKYKNLKIFIEKINKIIKSKKEIKNALKSDAKYM